MIDLRGRLPVQPPVELHVRLPLVAWRRTALRKE